ncbi:MAG: hypothetical protein A4E74_02521 [Syntrophus sp. PtaB.Bin075]|nr:MAG: hypothetical protein A4E74_02521 [Syntrophus sp. PtaB.Bin075]
MRLVRYELPVRDRRLKLFRKVPGQGVQGLQGIGQFPANLRPGHFLFVDAIHADPGTFRGSPDFHQRKGKPEAAEGFPFRRRGFLIKGKASEDGNRFIRIPQPAESVQDFILAGGLDVQGTPQSPKFKQIVPGAVIELFRDLTGKDDVEDRITQLRPVLDAQKITGLFPSGISGQPVNLFPKEGIKQKIGLHGTDNDEFPLLINIFPEGDVLQERPDVNERSNLFSFPLP